MMVVYVDRARALSQGDTQRCVHAVTPYVQTSVESARRSEDGRVRRLGVPRSGRLRPKQQSCQKPRV